MPIRDYVGWKCVICRMKVWNAYSNCIPWVHILNKEQTKQIPTKQQEKNDKISVTMAKIKNVLEHNLSVMLWMHALFRLYNSWFLSKFL